MQSTILPRPIACALLLWYLPACTSWHVEKGVSLLQLISTEHPPAVRLTRADGSYIVLHQPRMSAGDSLTGVHNGVPSRVAVSDVTQVAIRKVSADKTIALAFGISVIAIIAWSYWHESCLRQYCAESL
jgi:hypothetical protein